MESVFANQVFGLRKAKGITQEQLANVLGVSAQAVSKWENGSYPEGDLLPKLADYFEVSIDYLYGRDKGDVSVNQRIVDEIKKIFREKPEDSQKDTDYLEKLLDLNWAAHIGSWTNQDDYYSRPSYDIETGRAASLVVTGDGLSYLRMNNDLEYHFSVKEPKEGFATFFENRKEMAEIFSFFGDKDNLLVVYMLMTMTGEQVIEPGVIAKRVGLDIEKVKSALHFLTDKIQAGNPLVKRMSIIDDFGETKEAYTCGFVFGPAILMLLSGIEQIMNPSNNFILMSGYRNTAWFTAKKEKENE